MGPVLLIMDLSRGQQQHGKVYEIPGIMIKGFVVLRGCIKGFCPRIPGFLSKFVRDSHPVADPSGCIVPSTCIHGRGIDSIRLKY